MARRAAKASNGEINRELSLIKRGYSLAIKDRQITSRPYIQMLAEAPPRVGFFEPAQHAAVLQHLPPDLRPVIIFAYICGWRIDSKILPLQW